MSTRATATAIKAEIETIQAEIVKLEALMARRQTEFRTVLDCSRAEQLMADLLRLTADLMSARESAARLEDELTALRVQRFLRPWWWRMLGGLNPAQAVRLPDSSQLTLLAHRLVRPNVRSWWELT
jgi:hypothetical protein